VSKTERNHPIGGMERFNRDNFVELEGRRQSHRCIRSDHLPAIDAFTGAGLTAGTLFHGTGVNLDGIGLGTQSNKGQPADQGNDQPHICNLIPTPLLSNEALSYGRGEQSMLLARLNFLNTPLHRLSDAQQAARPYRTNETVNHLILILILIEIVRL